MVLSIQVANVVLTTVVADQFVATTQSPEAVTKMALASDVAVVQVLRQLLTPRGRSPTTDPRKIAQCLSRERQQQSAKEMQQQSKPCLQRSREPSSRRSPQDNAAPTTLLRYHWRHTYEFSVILMGRHTLFKQRCKAIASLQSTLKEGPQA